MCHRIGDNCGNTLETFATKHILWLPFEIAILN